MRKWKPESNDMLILMKNIVMLVEQLAHAQPPLKQVILEWNDKLNWNKFITSNSLKAGEADPEGKHLALAQMSPNRHYLINLS